MSTIDTMETLAFSRWDSTARQELSKFAKRTDIKIVDIRRQKNDLVVTFRRLVPAQEEVATTMPSTIDSDSPEYPAHL